MKTTHTTAAARLNDQKLRTAEGFAQMMANEIAANGVKSEYYTRALEAWLQDSAAARIVVDGDGPAARAKAAQMAHAAAVAQMDEFTDGQKADTPLYAYMQDPAKMLHFLRSTAPAIIDPATNELQFATRVSIARRAADMTAAARAEMRVKCQPTESRPAAYVEIPAGELSKTPLKGSPYFVSVAYVDLFRALVAGDVPTLKARRKDFGAIEDAAPAVWYGTQHGDTAPAVYALKLSDRWSYARILPLIYKACSKAEEDERKAKAKAEKAARRAAEKAVKAAPATGEKAVKKGGKKAA